MSFDEVGRLLPAECQGDNVADEDSGVTEDTVNVSVLSIDFEPLASIGFAASNFDPTAAFETFVAAVNDAGGVCGRTIDVQRVLYDILQGQAGQACVEATEDRANLIVSISTYDQPRCITDTGLPALTAAVFDRLGGLPVSAAAGRIALDLRGRQCLDAVRDALDQARIDVQTLRTRGTAGHLGLETVAADIQTALRALGPLLGKDVTEDVFENIFANFCIGK